MARRGGPRPLMRPLRDLTSASHPGNARAQDALGQPALSVAAGRPVRMDSDDEQLLRGGDVVRLDGDVPELASCSSSSADLHSGPRMLGSAGRSARSPARVGAARRRAVGPGRVWSGGERHGELRPSRVVRCGESLGGAALRRAASRRGSMEGGRAVADRLYGSGYRDVVTLGGGAWLAGLLWRC